VLAVVTEEIRSEQEATRLEALRWIHFLLVRCGGGGLVRVGGPVRVVGWVEVCGLVGKVEVVGLVGCWARLRLLNWWDVGQG